MHDVDQKITNDEMMMTNDAVQRKEEMIQSDVLDHECERKSTEEKKKHRWIILNMGLYMCGIEDHG
jgi:hypothetical protein